MPFCKHNLDTNIKLQSIITDIEKDNKMPNDQDSKLWVGKIIKLGALPPCHPLTLWLVTNDAVEFIYQKCSLSAISKQLKIFM